MTAAATHAREDQAGVGDADNNTSAIDLGLALVQLGVARRRTIAGLVAPGDARFAAEGPHARHRAGDPGRGGLAGPGALLCFRHDDLLSLAWCEDRAGVAYGRTLRCLRLPPSAPCARWAPRSPGRSRACWPAP